MMVLFWAIMLALNSAMKLGPANVRMAFFAVLGMILFTAVTFANTALVFEALKDSGLTVESPRCGEQSQFCVVKFPDSQARVFIGVHIFADSAVATSHYRTLIITPAGTHSEIPFLDHDDGVLIRYGAGKNIVFRRGEVIFGINSREAPIERLKTIGEILNGLIVNGRLVETYVPGHDRPKVNVFGKRSPDELLGNPKDWDSHRLLTVPSPQ